MKLALFFLSTFFGLNSYGACNFIVPTENVKVIWTAFKTPKKVGVQGEFKKFSFNAPTAADVASVIKATTFTIDSSSVSTGNPARDKTIVTNFFVLKNKPLQISGRFLSVDAKKAVMTLKINGQEKNVNLDVAQEGDTWKLTGEINVLEFALKESFDNIALACKALHEGVTWPDVKLALEVSAKRSCD